MAQIAKASNTPVQMFGQEGSASQKNQGRATGIRTAGAYHDQGGVHLAGGIVGGGGGRDFIVARRAQAADALGQGITDEEGDVVLRDKLRNILSGELDSYGAAAEGRDRRIADAGERGLARNVAQMQRQAGGTGVGSLQRGRGLGEILAGAQREQGAALNQSQLQRGQELAGLAGVGQNVLGQSLAERAYTLNQANTLAQLLQQQADAEQGSFLATRDQGGPSDFEKFLGYGLQAGGIAAGAGAFGGGGGGSGLTINYR